MPQTDSILSLICTVLHMHLEQSEFNNQEQLFAIPSKNSQPWPTIKTLKTLLLLPLQILGFQQKPITMELLLPLVRNPTTRTRRKSGTTGAAMLTNCPTTRILPTRLIRTRRPWGSSGGTPRGSTAGGTRKRGDPPYSRVWLSSPSVGSSKAPILYPPLETKRRRKNKNHSNNSGRRRRKGMTFRAHPCLRLLRLILVMRLIPLNREPPWIADTRRKQEKPWASHVSKEKLPF